VQREFNNVFPSATVVVVPDELVLELDAVAGAAEEQPAMIIAHRTTTMIRTPTLRIFTSPIYRILITIFYNDSR
jgi:hypothetical protein